LLDASKGAININSNARIKEGSIVIGPVTIGSHVYIESNTRIQDTTIREFTYISKSQIIIGSTIGQNSILINQEYLTEETNIPFNTIYYSSRHMSRISPTNISLLRYRLVESCS